MQKKFDWFITGLLLMIVLAYFFPQIGKTNGMLPMKTITEVGITLVFFFYGLKLSIYEFKDGMRNWRLHIWVHISTFIIFPVIILLAYPFIKTESQKLLWLGMLFLAALPSTVSSAVVMVSIAKGNVPAAILNASLSGLIGIIVTPLWISFFMQTGNNSYSLPGIFFQLIIKVIVPVIAGMLLYRFWGKWARLHRKILMSFDKIVVLLIVFHSFCNSFSQNIFKIISIKQLIVLFAIVILLFIIVYNIMALVARLKNFNRADTIALLFCGSKKSLMHGSVFSKVLFANSPYIGIFLIPIMLYHAMQIVVVGFIARKKAKQLTITNNPKLNNTFVTKKGINKA